MRYSLIVGFLILYSTTVVFALSMHGKRFQNEALRTCSKLPLAERECTFNMIPVANFTAPDSSIDCEAIAVLFQNQSVGDSLSYAWVFPGGSPALSSEVNPEVTFANTGTFQVTLIASNAFGADTLVRNIHIDVLGYPEASFSYAITGNGLVSFSNLSQNADNYNWSFGDNSPPLDTFETDHQYTQNGSYTVMLIADNFCGTSVIQETIEVQLTNVSALSSQKAIRLYPNPFSDILNVDCSELKSRPLQLEVLTQTRQIELVETKPMDRSFKLNLQALPPGAYWVRIRFADFEVNRLILHQ